MVTQSELKKLFRYSKETGLFTRLKDARNKQKLKGSIVTTKNDRGYITIRINKKTYSGHRLAFLYINGIFPNNIDHINHNQSDNRWCNLRDVTLSENQKNRKYQKTNSGFLGVRYNQGKWSARIMVNSKEMPLGRFVKKSDAIKARKEANIKYEFHENHGA